MKRVNNTHTHYMKRVNNTHTHTHTHTHRERETDRHTDERDTHTQTHTNTHIESTLQSQEGNYLESNAKNDYGISDHVHYEGTPSHPATPQHIHPHAVTGPQEQA